MAATNASTRKRMFASAEAAALWFNIWTGIGLLGALLVVLGGIGAWRADNAKEAFSGDRERKSEERISENEAEAAKANEGLANAHVEIERQKALNAQAMADAANANARAEEAKLALEQFRAPRRISSAKIEGLSTKLSKYSGTDVAIYTAGDGPEVGALATSISNLLNKARWNALIWNWSGVSINAGIFVIAQPGSGADVLAARDGLVAALKSADLQAAAQDWPGQWAQFGGMLNGPSPPAPTAAPLRVLVGSKP
jgi:hypothetical protein